MKSTEYDLCVYYKPHHRAKEGRKRVKKKERRTDKTKMKAVPCAGGKTLKGGTVCL